MNTVSAIPKSSPWLLTTLIYKDWHFTRYLIAGYLLVGIVALGLLASANKPAFYAGSVLLITALITIGIHIPIVTIVNERKSNTDTFVMTLPVSLRDYHLIKLAANLLLMLLPSLLLLFGCLLIIAKLPELPDGLLPFAAVLLGYAVTGSVVILCAAMLTESMGWTVGVMAISNLLFQGMVYFVGNLPGMQTNISTNNVIWDNTITLLMAEVMVSVGVLTLTLLWKIRHTNCD